jgi:ABC-type transport system involved in multi-copper enzyme maturation permease subunit
MDLMRTMTGITALTLHSTKKLLLSRKLLITILVAVFVATVMGYAGSQDVDPLPDGTNLMDALILFFFMPVMAMIFGTSLIRDEIDDKSITHVATAPLDRAYSYIGYYIPLVIVVIVSMVIIDTAGFLAFFAQQGLTSEAVELYLEFTALVTIGAFVYSALFLAVSVAFKKPVFIGLFYAFIWEGFIGSLPGAIQKASVKHYLRSLGSRWVDYGDISSLEGVSSLGDSILVLSLMSVILLVLGAYMFRREEIS